jgi:hypothetical protein
MKIIPFHFIQSSVIGRQFEILDSFFFCCSMNEKKKNAIFHLIQKSVHYLYRINVFIKQS